MLKIGQVIQNRYEIISLLGKGGMGNVYKARDITLKRLCALKEMLPDPYADASTLNQAMEQFRREAEALARLSHPNLPGVYDYFSWASKEYLVMEFIEGEALSELLTQYPNGVPQQQVWLWMAILIDALEYCHGNGVVHRDVKPANIIRKPNGDVVLVDFGLAKLVDLANPMTATIIRGLGTPEYAPLEQFQSQGHTDARSDIYSLGATLYHLLSGSPPLEVPKRLLCPSQFQTLRQQKASISPRIEEIVLKALAIYPDDRYQSVAEMRQAMQDNILTRTLWRSISRFIVPICIVLVALIIWKLSAWQMGDSNDKSPNATASVFWWVASHPTQKASSLPPTWTPTPRLTVTPRLIPTRTLTQLQTLIPTPSLIKTSSDTPLPTTMTTSSPVPPQTALMPATYSLLDDLENLTVEDSQGRVFTYAPIADYPGWKLLEPWGRVCNPSQHPGHAVGGVFLPGQVLIHPVSTDNATIVTREFYPLIYDTLILDYAMADGAVTGSNGVLVSIMLTNEYNESIVVVPPTKVTQNRWTEQAVDLSRFIGQRVTLRLEVDAIGNTSYDWLEVELFLELAQQQ